MSSKFEKIKCEICGEDDKNVLHLHHVIERKQINTTNDKWNLACLCANCHNKIHSKEIIVLDIFPSTKPPYGRSIVYSVNGKSNIDGINEKYIEQTSNSMKIWSKDE